MPSAKDVHNAWALAQWERYHDLQAQRAPKEPEFVTGLEDMDRDGPIDWEDAKRRWNEAKQ